VRHAWQCCQYRWRFTLCRKNRRSSMSFSRPDDSLFLINCSIPTKRHCDPPIPASAELYAVNAVQEIDPVRRDTELKNDSRLQEFVFAADLRHGTSPELLQGREETFGILGGGLEKQINISGQTRVSIMDDGLPPHDQVPYRPMVEDAKKFHYVLGKNGLHQACLTVFPPAPECRTRTTQDSRTSGHLRP
jgi:hypothetical protein